MDFLHWLSTVGGVCTTATALGRVTARELRQLRDRGAIWAPLRGWAALDSIRNEVTRALALGGVISCVSAFRAHGLWTPHGDRHLHVRVHRETYSERAMVASATDGVRVHRLPQRLPEQRPWDGVDSILTSLAVASTCISSTDLLAAADAALQQGRVSRDQMLELASRLPKTRGGALERATGLSGSGPESTFVEMLRRARIAFRQQPELLPGEFCDFLIGKSLVVEVDSLEWHGSRERMANDRRRDALLTALGYRVLRFTYEQVMFQPETVMRIVLDLVRRDVHERAPFRTAA